MNCLFCGIAQRKIPASIVFEDEHLIAFDDVNPQAPTHCLVIPKQHIATLNDVDSAHEQLLGQLVVAAKKNSRFKGI